MSTATVAGHTPGNWVVIGMPGVDFLGITSEQGAGIADHAIAKVHGSDARGRANARLIAAAPELLDIAQEASHVRGAELFPVKARALDTVDRIRAAIAKATGGQP